MQLLELRVQLHELPRHTVDASVQVPVLAVLPVEVQLVALPPLRAAYPGVRPEQNRELERTLGATAKRSFCDALTEDSPLCRRPLQAPWWKTTLYLALQKYMNRYSFFVLD